MSQPLWQTILAASGVAAIFSGLFQLLTSTLTGARERRTWSRNTRLTAAIEFFTACSALRAASITVATSDRMRRGLQERVDAGVIDKRDVAIAAAIEATYVGDIDRRERQRVRSLEALSSMRLGFRHMEPGLSDFRSRCDELDGTADAIEDMRSRLESEVIHILGLDRDLG